MYKMNGIKRLATGIVFLGGILIMSGCIFKLLIPAPKRSFLPQDLLLVKEDLPPQWSVAFGPIKAGEYAKPSDSMETALLKLTEEKLLGDKKWDVRESVYPFNSIEGAKEDYAETTTFPGETNIEGWTFWSSLADEQKFSCYTYSNVDFPVCTWVARYEEIEIQVIAWINPNRLTLDEVQALVKRIDEKVFNSLKQ